MARNSSIKNPRNPWVLGRNSDFFGFERKNHPDSAWLSIRLHRQPQTSSPARIRKTTGSDSLPENPGCRDRWKQGRISVSSWMTGEKAFSVRIPNFREILVQENEPTGPDSLRFPQRQCLGSSRGTTGAWDDLLPSCVCGKYRRCFLWGIQTDQTDRELRRSFAGKPEGQGWFRSDWFGLFLPRQRKLGLSPGLRVDLPRTDQSKWYLVLERANRMVMDPRGCLALPLDEQPIELDLLLWQEGRTTHFWGLLNQSVFRWRNPVSWAGSTTPYLSKADWGTPARPTGQLIP